MSGSMDGAASADPAAQVWTTRELFARHKLIGISAVVLLILLLAIIVGGILASSPTAIADSSTCSTWSSANQAQQQAYGMRFIREHGAPPGASRDAAGVVAAVNAGCTQAFDNDVQDTASVVDAARGQ
ncbi:MAG: hypothetical protein JO027_17240 [Solirubrobacterales bacterium]|nr:hypothetical protein [Solirubrobacterales bacterium]